MSGGLQVDYLHHDYHSHQDVKNNTFFILFPLQFKTLLCSCNTLDEDLHNLDVEICSFELVLQTAGWKVVGSNPSRVIWDFSALTGSYPELGVLWVQWEGWDHTAELHPHCGCVLEGVNLIT